jgi:hypothetical protein
MVAVGELQAEVPRQAAPDRGLPGTHGADELVVAGGMHAPMLAAGAAAQAWP